jgi:tetratricopeptide (TPR) repeat protein
MLALGWRQFQAGELSQAEQAFRRASELDPQQVDAWYLLGVVAQSQGRAAEAIAHYEQGLSIRPDHPHIHHNLGVAYDALGRTDEAIACFQNAVRLKPDHADSYQSLGFISERQGRAEDAIRWLRDAARLKPDADSYQNLGLIHERQGRAEEAIRWFGEAAACHRQMLEERPQDGDAYHKLGYVLAKSGRQEEALASLRQAAELKPDAPEVHNDLGHVLATLGRHEEAIACYQKAMEVRPGFAMAHNNFGLALAAQGRLREAVAQYREALRQRADCAPALNNLGVALDALDQPDEAIGCYQEALRIEPQYVEARINLGTCLADRNKFDDAAVAYQKAIEMAPQFAEAHSSLGHVLLAQGRYDEGWREYEWRRRERDAVKRAFPQPEWNGEPLGRRTILLHAEQGLGDTILLIRYALLVKERGGRVVFECPKALGQLLAHVEGIDELVVQGSPLPSFDFHCPLASLPMRFRTKLETVPAQVPYLFADPDLVERWRKELSQRPGMKVGIIWQGNPKYAHDKQRSIPFECFAALARVPGVTLVSLQKGPGAGSRSGGAPPATPTFAHKGEGRNEAGPLPAIILRMEGQRAGDDFQVVGWGDRLDEASGPFMDTAAIIRNLDLVIAPDTAIANLAGAMGAPVWLALATVADWRWLLNREDSPWYPTVRIFRQRERGNWAEVFERMAGELTRQASFALCASAHKS